MATQEQKEKLVEILKFTSCTYTISISGYGREHVVGCIPNQSNIKYLKDNNIQWEWNRGFPHLDPSEQHRIEINKNGLNVLFVHSYSHDDHALALREAVEYVMDQEEL